MPRTTKSYGRLYSPARPRGPRPQVNSYSSARTPYYKRMQGSTQLPAHTRIRRMRSGPTGWDFVMHVCRRAAAGHPYGKGAPIVTTRRPTLRHCRRETEKQAHAPRYRGRKPGAKSFELHLLERARRRSVRRVRWLWPEAWAAWPAWMQNEDPWQPQHVLCTIDRHYALLTAQLRKRPFYVHVDLKTWKSSANVKCRLVRQRLWRGFYSV